MRECTHGVSKFCSMTTAGARTKPTAYMPMNPVKALSPANARDKAQPTERERESAQRLNGRRARTHALVDHASAAEGEGVLERRQLRGRRREGRVHLEGLDGAERKGREEELHHRCVGDSVGCTAISRFVNAN